MSAPHNHQWIRHQRWGLVPTRTGYMPGLVTEWIECSDCGEIEDKR